VKLFAIGDLHMPGDAGKTMDIFGEEWHEHLPRVADDWDSRVADGDVVLIPGDITWAMRLEGAMRDLEWIGERPGIKVMIRGNHDYWWQSIKKVRAALPSGCHAIQNDCWLSPDGSLAVAGTRLWDVPDLRLGDIFRATERVPDEVRPREFDPARDRKIFDREMGRLETSLRALPESAGRRVVMVHYPPTSARLEDTPVTQLLERHRVELCVFGHLHALKPGVTFDGTRNGVRYLLTSVDAVGFSLVEIS